MTRLWIAGSLFVDAVREVHLASESGVPLKWFDVAQAVRPDPIFITPAPVLLRDSHGTLEHLNWFDEDASSPRFSLGDKVEAWVVDEKDTIDSPNLVEAIRLCLYDLPKVNANIKDVDLRCDLLRRIANNEALRGTLARQVLNVEDREIFFPSNIKRLLKNQVTSRTVQRDLKKIRDE